jgi:hypothetical protein
VSDDRDRGKPPHHDRLSGPLREKADTDEITARHTIVPDEGTRLAFVRLDKRVERIASDAESTENFLRDKIHNVSNAVTKHHEEMAVGFATIETGVQIATKMYETNVRLIQEVAAMNAASQVHEKVDEQRFGKIDIRIEAQGDEIVEVKEKQAEGSRLALKIAAGALGLGLSIAGGVITAWIVMGGRVQRVEDRLDAAKEHAEQHDAQVDHNFEKLDTRLEAIGSRLGIAPTSTTTP